MKKHLLLAEFSSQLWALTPDYLSLMAGVLVNWSVSGPVSPK